MIEVRIPNNIVDYKSKFLFGLTGRQFICVATTAVLIGLDLKFLMPYIGDFAIGLAAVPAAIAAAFGWFEPYGMPFEKYLKSVLFQSLLAPKYRKARFTDSSIVPCDKNHTPIPDSGVAPEVLTCVTQVREAMGVVEDETATKAKKKQRKKKYRKSKQALL